MERASMSHRPLLESLVAAINGNDPAGVRATAHDDFVSYGAVGDVKGPDGFEAIMYKNIHTGFPDLQLELTTVIEQDDMVAFRIEGSGTHTGLFLGIDGTGKTVRFRGFHQARVEDGLIVELWQGPD